MNEIEIWKIFVSLGVPGVALGVFYFLFLKVNFFNLPSKWAGPVSIVFMLFVFLITTTALNLWSPNTKPDINSKGNETVHEEKVEVNQITTGENSPAISNVNGDVNFDIKGDKK